MTIPSVTNSAIAADSAVTLTISSNSDRVLIFFAGGWDNNTGPAFTSVTFDPGGGDEASFTNEASSNIGFTGAGGRYLRAETWYLVLSDGVSSGDYTIDYTTNQSLNHETCSAWEVADADTTDPIGASGTGSGTTDTLSASVTTTDTNSLVAMGGVMYEEVTFTPGAGDTEETELNSAQCSGWSGYTPASSVGAYTVSCTSSVSPATDDWVATAVEIFEAAGAGGRTTKNTDSNPLGLNTGIGWRVNTP